MTLILDDDLVAKVRSEAHRSNRSFREVVNEAIRRGLPHGTATKLTEPFRVTARDLGDLRPGLGLDDISELLERNEGPLHR